MLPAMSSDHEEQKSWPGIDGKMVKQHIHHFKAMKSLAAVAQSATLNILSRRMWLSKKGKKNKATKTSKTNLSATIWRIIQKRSLDFTVSLASKAAKAKATYLGFVAQFPTLLNCHSPAVFVVWRNYLAFFLRMSTTTKSWQCNIQDMIQQFAGQLENPSRNFSRNLCVLFTGDDSLLHLPIVLDALRRTRYSTQMFLIHDWTISVMLRFHTMLHPKTQLL